MQPIIIEGISYSYVKDRLMGGSLFATADRSKYLRVNVAAEIAGEVNITRDLYKRGFPVPRVLGSGTLDSGDGYFIEESIGDKVFADTFDVETRAEGHASDASFEMLIALIKKYCEAQFSPANYVPHDKDELLSMIGLPNVMRNILPRKKCASRSCGRLKRRRNER